MSLNMFGTLRYDRDDEHPEFIDRTRSFLGETAAEHRACESCRSRKVQIPSSLDLTQRFGSPHEDITKIGFYNS